MRKLKFWYFVLAALNTFATTWFSSYLFFLLRDRFGFGNRENLWVSALYGLVYIPAAWQGGKFAQRRGFITSLKVGFAGLALMMIFGGLMHSVIGILCAMVGYTIALLFIWPALEALVSENETQAGVQHNVGIYNCTWALAGFVAYFIGGKLYDWFAHAAVFWIPAALFALQFAIAVWLGKKKAESRELKVEDGAKPATSFHGIEPSDNGPSGASPKSHPLPGGEGRGEGERNQTSSQATAHPEETAFRQPVPPKRFLQMAWLANPFAYVGINTVIAVMPGVGSNLGLTPTEVGFFCSVWWFARLVTFALLWQWRGWHYRFRWLLTSFIMLVASFPWLLRAGHIWPLIIAQLFFGFAVGLIYYSSLFYSMDVGGDTQGEHCGLHEAAIGVGAFVG